MKPVDPWAINSRTETSFRLRTSTHRHTYRVMTRLVVDDLMVNMAKAEAHLVNTGEDLTYLPEKKLIDYLIKTNIVLGGS